MSNKPSTTDASHGRRILSCLIQEFLNSILVNSVPSGNVIKKNWKFGGASTGHAYRVNPFKS